MSAQLISLSTAVPPFVVDQSEVEDVARAAFGRRFEAFERLAKVYSNAGIRHRHVARPLDWYLGHLGWPERTEAFLEVAGDLFVEAATRALDAAGLSAGEVDTVVTVCSTGIATPSLEARVAGRLGFRDDVMRVPVFGLGCAGGVSGLAIASRLAEARPDSVVLMVTVELCSLAFRIDQLTKANIVATALFGDGAAACVLRAGETGIAAVEASGQKTWPGTLDIMGWSIDPQGFGVIFDQAIPPFVETHLGSAAAEVLGRSELTIDDVDRFVCHPGGTKVIAALERALQIGQGALDHERAVLAEDGNMSAPTVLFVLDRVIRAGLPARTVLTALGPGFTASFLSLKRAA